MFERFRWALIGGSPDEEVAGFGTEIKGNGDYARDIGVPCAST
jgi:hypothetical protein